MNKERGKKAPCFKQLVVFQRQSIVFNRELQEPLHAGCFPSFFFLLMNSNVSEKHAFERRKAKKKKKRDDIKNNGKRKKKETEIPEENGK